MTIITVNAKKARYCAFCSYWFDPECRAIHPIPYAWRCDCSIQNICTKEIYVLMQITYAINMSPKFKLFDSNLFNHNFN